MELKPGDRVLDLSCGAGWATRLLAEAVAGGQGMAAGLDISEEMIARARACSRELENVLFAIGAADEIPWRDEYFDRVLSIESFYYYPDQEAVLRELYRVLVPGGQLFILINLYQENPHSLGWVKQLKVPVHVRSEKEYLEMLRAQGFADVAIVAHSRFDGEFHSPRRRLVCGREAMAGVQADRRAVAGGAQAVRPPRPGIQ